jgi:1,4-alpha-glucan branching enzyme
MKSKKQSKSKSNKLTQPLRCILKACHHDPFEVLGRHVNSKQALVRVFLPHADQVEIVEIEQPMERIPGSDFFEWHGDSDSIPTHYSISWVNESGERISRVDPYCFGPQLQQFDMHLFQEGNHWHAYRFLGAHFHTAEGYTGTLFAVWAPNAKRVSVVGDFNHWDGRVHPMRSRGETGIWELFVPELEAGCHYKFELLSMHGDILLKTDPYGNQFQIRPDTASIVSANPAHEWNDLEWLSRRKQDNWLQSPMSIYEIHLGSWRRGDNNEFMNYREIAHRLTPYILELGFTHIELLPITEHPFDGSWGYQTTGYFAPSSRFGTPDDFRYFVDQMHQNGIGVILDWVPAHFPKDHHALGQFDGSALYEHEDPRKGEHRDWGTLIFNYGRAEVKNFLLASAVYWLEEFHLDGLRVDAVASMLYLDYSREDGDWLPNEHGGRENLEAVKFLQQLNTVTHDEFPGTVILAEESTAWPQVSGPTWLGGLGFSMKWNMGWMHDTLSFMEKDPIHRHYHHDLLTFGLLYCFTENFVLPFSHDEVVHGKGSLLDKMPGDDWQRFASVRLLFSYMFTYPGKKLLFMGNEFAQGSEWNDDGELDWYLLDRPQHHGIKLLVSELNRLYREIPALHNIDFEHGGFEWVDCHDAAQSVLSYLRRGPNGEFVVVLLNFTPIPRDDYRIGLPVAGRYRELFNSDSEYYGGANIGNTGEVSTRPTPWMGHEQSLTLRLPPLGALILQTAE